MFRIVDKGKFSDLYFNDMFLFDSAYLTDGIIETDYEDYNFSFIRSLCIDDIKNTIIIKSFNNETYLDVFNYIDISEKDNKLIIELSATHTDGKINDFISWKPTSLYKKIDEILSRNKNYSVAKHGFVDKEVYTITFISDYKSIDKALNYINDQVQSIINHANCMINSSNWRNCYTSELEFCYNILRPLLINMKYDNVYLTHGKNEFGKDFIFSEINKFNRLLYYGIQAKIGKISGEANSEIDNLLGQIEDAFSMPFQLPGKHDDLYISHLFIITDNFFSENAIKKINEKNKEYNAIVSFIDGAAIEILINKYL